MLRTINIVALVVVGLLLFGSIATTPMVAAGVARFIYGLSSLCYGGAWFILWAIFFVQRM